MIDQKQLASAIEQLQQEQQFSGAMLISQDREIVFEQAWGFASRQLSVPNTLETKFHIASVTKMFIAMAALIQVEQGRIALKERPARYLPELATLDKDITLHHLLSHTSGLRDIYDVPNLRFEMNKHKIEGGDLLSYLVKLPQEFRPGEKWSYSSTGYILTGYLLERVTGLSFAELMKNLMFTPLAMHDTGLDNPRRVNPGRAYGHLVEDGQWINAENDGLSMFEDVPGELYSTVRDLKLWCDAMFDCPLVASQTLQLMLTPYAQAWSPFQYGYGWFLAPQLRMHGGGTPGFASYIRQYPQQRVSVILLLNADQANPGTLLRAIEPLLVG